MKTPPVQQKQDAGSRHESSGMESEGKSLAPPTFQLKASDAKPVQRQPIVHTITDDTAYLREGPPTFTSLKTTIPQGTRVEVVEEKKGNGGTYTLVKDHITGAELGWTAKSNSEDLDKKYKNASATYNYHVGGYDLLVFLPKDGIKKSNPDVFMFFHGDGGNYKTTKTHAKNGGYDDNPAIGAKIPDAVSKSGNIAICPQSHNYSTGGEWSGIGEGKFKAMVDTTLAQLTIDLDLAKKPLTAGNVSIAGHSGGGGALGQAAKDTGATDVTLQEAGYNFSDSWTRLRDWFLLGPAPKTMRVITQNNGGKYATRRILKEATKVKGKPDPAGKFNPKEIVTYSQKLVKDGELAGPVTVEEFKGEDKVEAGGIVLERGYRVLRDDGSLQGSLRLYHLADEEADHWAASTQTMETSMTSGAVDRKADEEAMKKR